MIQSCWGQVLANWVWFWLLAYSERPHTVGKQTACWRTLILVMLNSSCWLSLLSCVLSTNHLQKPSHRLASGHSTANSQPHVDWLVRHPLCRSCFRLALLLKINVSCHWLDRVLHNVKQTCQRCHGRALDFIYGVWSIMLHVHMYIPCTSTHLHQCGAHSCSPQLRN